ncbi:MAG: hypothetical protein MZV64_14465 [Ignavibacteriales bacterium]|nr:hypothetical protein [Ignavibacteriales bacterium]
MDPFFATFTLLAGIRGRPKDELREPVQIDGRTVLAGEGRRFRRRVLGTSTIRDSIRRGVSFQPAPKYYKNSRN